MVRGGERSALSATEVKLLRYLAEHPQRAVSQEELLERVWGYAATARSRTVRTTVGRVRQKLEGDPTQPRVLLTEYGEGYRLVVSAPRLPPVGDRIVGRERELATLQEAFGADARLVTVVGPGGMGKTRLARAWAERTGASWLDATEVTESSELVAAMARTLEVAPGPDLADRTARLLGERGGPWVIDNLEQVADAGSVLDRWALATPRIVATSRVPLGGRGESVLELGPLEPPDAAELLIARCGAVRLDPGRKVDDAVVRELVDQLSGMPLALELAAAATEFLPLSELVQRWSPALLADDRPGRPSRHRSLEAALAGSLASLSSDERAVLRTVAASVGGLRLDDLEAMTEGETLPAVRRLRRTSLLRLPQARYTVLEPVRRQLSDAPEMPAVRERHAAHFHTVAQQLGRSLFGTERDAAASRMRDERGNLVAALRRLPAVPAVEVVDALHPMAEEDPGWLGELEALAVRLGDPVALAVPLASALRRAERRPEAGSLLDAALRREATAPALDERARCAFLDKEHEAAVDFVTRGLAMAPTPRIRGRLRRTRGMLARVAGDVTTAKQAFLDAIVAFDEAGERRGGALARSDLGQLLCEEGEFEQAERALRRADAALEAEGANQARAVVLERLSVLLMARDLEAGRGMLEQAAALAERTGAERTASYARWRIATSYLDYADGPKAEALLM
ncbi:MAG: winged helix-turn-helix domain-containing protein, partial [Myxococcota bacterium]